MSPITGQDLIVAVLHTVRLPPRQLLGPGCDPDDVSQGRNLVF